MRLCKYTNYCEALDQRHREVTCELWDREGLDEVGVARSADGKRRLVAPEWAALDGCASAALCARVAAGGGVRARTPHYGGLQ